MYAAAGGASLAGRKARQHGRQPAPPGSHPTSPVHPAPTGVRAFSCQHWESRLAAPPTRAQSALEPHSTCDLAECAAGRAAWQEAAAFAVGGGGAGAGGAARRCSVLGDHPTARRDPRSKWVRNNRVRDASYGSSSESDGEPDDKNDTWGVARLLYAGLGTLAVGLVVYFVGTGDKGFKTPALRLVGPSLIIAGLACCLLRITFCIFAKPCCRRRTNFKESRRLSGCAEGEEMPLAGGGSGPRAGPAQCSPARRLDASSCDVSSLSSGEEDERLRRYRNPEGQQSASILQPSVQNTSPQSTPPIPEPAVPSAMRQSASHPTAVRVAPSALPSAQPNASALPSTSLPSAVRQSTSIPSAVRQSASIPSTVRQSTSIPSAVRQSAPIPSTVRQSASIPSALHPGSQPPRRPPPRNVSFAGGPDGELVLSPAQLRS